MHLVYCNLDKFRLLVQVAISTVHMRSDSQSDCYTCCLENSFCILANVLKLIQIRGLVADMDLFELGFELI